MRIRKYIMNNKEIYCSFPLANNFQRLFDFSLMAQQNKELKFTVAKFFTSGDVKVSGK